MEVSIILKFRYQSGSHYWRLTCIAVFMMVALVSACSQKACGPESSQAPSLTAIIVEIDDHGNAVTDLEIAQFTERGWKLGDTLAATFETGQKIQIEFVENYGDVPVGDYLGRFSTSTKRFKIAINMGNIAKTLALKREGKVVLQKIDSPSAN